MIRARITGVAAAALVGLASPAGAQQTLPAPSAPASGPAQPPQPFPCGKDGVAVQHKWLAEMEWRVLQASTRCGQAQAEAESHRYKVLARQQCPRDWDDAATLPALQSALTSQEAKVQQVCAAPPRGRR